MRNEREKGYLWIRKPSAQKGSVLGGSSSGGQGKVGFDVSPGWRRALITEGGMRESMVQMS